MNSLHWYVKFNGIISNFTKIKTNIEFLDIYSFFDRRTDIVYFIYYWRYWYARQISVVLCFYQINLKKNLNNQWILFHFVLWKNNRCRILSLFWLWIFASQRVIQFPKTNKERLFVYDFRLNNELYSFGEQKATLIPWMKLFLTNTRIILNDVILFTEPKFEINFEKRHKSIAWIELQLQNSCKRFAKVIWIMFASFLTTADFSNYFTWKLSHIKSNGM